MLYVNCVLAVLFVLCRFLTVPRAGLQCMIVAFTCHTHLLFMPRHDNGRGIKCYLPLSVCMYVLTYVRLSVVMALCL